MKKILLFLLLMLSSYILFAQSEKQRPSNVRLQGLKLEFITKYLKLSSEEASFWPLYYEYNEEIRKARLEAPDDIIATEEKTLIIRKKYQVDFKKILNTDERVLKVFTIDREFNNLLKAELIKRSEHRNN